VIRLRLLQLTLRGAPYGAQSSPSTQVTPLTKRFDSIVRKMESVSGSI
jgi:hypothetical protein